MVVYEIEDSYLLNQLSSSVFDLNNMASPPERKPSLIDTMVSKTSSTVALAMLAGTLSKQLAPFGFKQFIFKALQKLYTHLSSNMTLVVQQLNDLTTNQIYSAAEAYLRPKRLLSAKRLIVGKDENEKDCTLSTERVEDVVFDNFQGVRVKWKFIANGVPHLQQHHPSNNRPDQYCSSSHYELSFHKKHKDKVLNSYLPYILNTSKQGIEESKVIKLHTTATGDSYGHPYKSKWRSVTLDHPITFDKLAMDDTLKKAIIQDLERFVNRKDFYRRVGKPWKRGYLLYGPPGTGKSSLIAAMANHIKFDIYDLELTDIQRNSDLRRVMLSTANRSILVVEDIDCSLDFTSNVGAPRPIYNNHSSSGVSQQRDKDVPSRSQLTLSGMLNFMDGLWSSCGDERIIIFTTNNKDKLDPALLRPGRMDLHIHMSYCTPCGFRVLANNYLQLDHHPLLTEIEDLLLKTKVTPAQVAEQLMKTDDPDIVLEDLVGFLHQKLQ